MYSMIVSGVMLCNIKPYLRCYIAHFLSADTKERDTRSASNLGERWN